MMMDKRRKRLFKEVSISCSCHYIKRRSQSDSFESMDRQPVWNCPTSDLLFKTRDNVHSLLQDRQLGLRFLVAEMQRAHAPELVKRIVNITHPDPADRPTHTEKNCIRLGCLQKLATLTPYISVPPSRGGVSGQTEGWPASQAVPIPRTCCSRVVIRLTACWSTPSFVCGFSWRMCSATMRSSSLNASFISRTRTLLTSASPTKQSIRSEYNRHQRMPIYKFLTKQYTVRHSTICIYQTTQQSIMLHNPAKQNTLPFQPLHTCC